MRKEYISMDQALVGVFTDLLESGEEVRPRGLLTRELTSYSFVLREPRARMIENVARKWSLRLAVGELCWHLKGSDAVDAIAHYTKRWLDFVDDATIRGACYGRRVFQDRDEEGFTQWERALRMLRIDTETRRAVLTLSAPQFVLAPDRKDVACAQTLQFLVRRGALHAVGTFRSNDAFWGLPYDVFLFTALQEIMANELSIPLGTYTHFAASMHLYERHFRIAGEVVAAGAPNASLMAPFGSSSEIPHLLAAECHLRAGRVTEAEASIELLSPGWATLANALHPC